MNTGCGFKSPCNHLASLVILASVAVLTGPLLIPLIVISNSKESNEKLLKGFMNHLIQLKVLILSVGQKVSLEVS